MRRRVVHVPLSLDEVVGRSHRLVTRVQNEHKPVATLCLFSGGRDSTNLLHLMRDRIDAVVHINTGIGIEDTRIFVRKTCADWGLDLIEEHPPPGCTYRELVLQYGFPGPGGHMVMYTRLKERGLRAVRRRFITNPRKERVLFLAGMRLAESSRRMRNTEETHRDGSVVWASPLTWWSNKHMAEYRELHDVPVNEVSVNLHMSGECLCGAFAAPGEKEMIRFFYPETAAELDALEAEVKAAGLPGCVWGQRPPRGVRNARPPGPLCSDCPTRRGE